MAYTVTAQHMSPDYKLDAQDFALVELGEWGSFRIGGDHANGYYAIAPKFGCGRTRPSPEAAIWSLLQSNGCDCIRVATS